MSITERPKFGQPRIADGTFVIFSFDPAAYALEIDPEDKILAVAADRITRKKYLGIVEGLGPIDLPRLRQNLDIRVVGLAAPQEGEDDVYPTNPTRCVPVYPTTNHAGGREPLTTSAPLPWPGCYVHTLQLVSAFVSRVHHANPTNATVGKDGMDRLATLVARDQCAARDEALALENNYDSDAESNHSAESGDNEYDSGSEESELGDPKALAPSHPFMEIWEDLTVATTLGKPKDVGADIDEIMDIGEEWQNRKKLKHCFSSYGYI